MRYSGFDLVEGKYYWAYFENSLMIVQCENERLMTFSMCGCDETIHAKDVTLLKEVEKYG